MTRTNCVYKRRLIEINSRTLLLALVKDMQGRMEHFESASLLQLG